MKHLLTIQITLFLIFLSGCTKKEKDRTPGIANLPNRTEKKLPQRQPTTSTNFDPCDCNKRSQKILDKTIAFRLQFENIQELKSDQASKKQIKEFATEYMELTKKCFEINNARLMEESECNNLKILETKQDSLHALGINIREGATIRL
tara:strand:- start:78 stop:521 length:444 start_codon:yes stop_codon:yes gene_type:complete